MTSQPDNKPRRRPPTIDLTATEIQTESPQSQSDGTAHEAGGNAAQAAPEPPAGPKYAGTLWSHAAAAVSGGVLLAALAVGLWASGMMPARDALPARPDSTTPAIQSQLTRIETELQKRPSDSGQTARLTNVEAQTKALSDSLAAINRRLDDIAAAAQSARQRADAAADAAKSAAQNASAAADAAKSATQNASAASDTAKGVAQNAAQNSVQRSDLDALAGRIAALERSIKALADSSAAHAANAADRAARGAIAAEALRTAVERGTPYQAELATVKTFGADQKDVAALQPFAATGVPTAAELARALSQLTPSLAAASGPKRNDGTFLGRLEDHARTLVRVTPVGAAPGDDPSAVISRLNVDAAHADIAAALADIDRLPPAAKSLAQSWVQKAKSAAEAIAASRRIATAALAGLSSANTQ